MRVQILSFFCTFLSLFLPSPSSTSCHLRQLTYQALVVSSLLPYTYSLTRCCMEQSFWQSWQ